MKTNTIVVKIAFLVICQLAIMSLSLALSIPTQNPGKTTLKIG